MDTTRGIRVEIDYPTGRRIMWVYDGTIYSLVDELLKLDYNLYKQQRISHYFYMGYKIHMYDEWSFEENRLYVIDQINDIEAMIDKLI